MKTQQLNEIHTSFVNGQRKQAIEQIDNYGVCDFFNNYPGYLWDNYCMTYAYECLRDSIGSYFKIKNQRNEKYKNILTNV